MSKIRPSGDDPVWISQQLPVPRTTRHVVVAWYGPSVRYSVVAKSFVVTLAGVRSTTWAGRPSDSAVAGAGEMAGMIASVATRRASQSLARGLKRLTVQWLRGRGGGFLLGRLHPRAGLVPAGSYTSWATLTTPYGGEMASTRVV